ncbi:MAG: NAD(P)H-dependent glycerol-3-phosphate dehydrogenase, partial [Pseudomonadota bacterium]
GVELAGALKNIYAIIAGFADAMGLGYNTKSMLMTRSLAEMSRLAVKLGADPLTFLGLAGVGDLFVTCTSPSSRNFRMGAAIGEGKNLEQAEEAIGQVVEGVNTLRTIKEKSVELDVYMPLVDALHGLMFENKALDELVSGMMASERAIDVSFSVE